jgi:hypothetical protein
MKIQRPLLATAVPVALALSCAAGALAASTPKVSVRVEGETHTLLAPRTVTAPSTGSITRAGAPADACPAASAAGALNAATHGDWGGTYSSGLGIEVTNILGTRALYAKGSYWEFFINDRAASEGVCDTRLKAGEQLLFAQVPAKGKAELPIVVRAPARVRAGHAFDVRTFVDTGRGTATEAVSRPSFTSTREGHGHGAASLTVTRVRPGLDRISVASPGTFALTASSVTAIRSAPFTVTVTR